jgi:hypothetical protein
MLTRRSLLAAVPAAAATAPFVGSQDPQKPATPARPAATPKTKFAANVEMWWGNLPFLERIQKAHELGFPAIEFWPWRGKDLAAIAAKTKELGIAVAQFTAWGSTSRSTTSASSPRSKPAARRRSSSTAG